MDDTCDVAGKQIINHPIRSPKLEVDFWVQEIETDLVSLNEATVGLFMIVHDCSFFAIRYGSKFKAHWKMCAFDVSSLDIFCTQLLLVPSSLDVRKDIHGKFSN